MVQTSCRVSSVSYGTVSMAIKSCSLLKTDIQTNNQM